MTHIGCERANLTKRMMDVILDLDEWSRVWINVPRGGLSPQLVTVLYCVHLRQSTTISSLANRLAVTPMAISASANRLEALGYVRRVPSMVDRRRVHLEITDLGREVIERVDRECKEDLSRQLLDLTDEQVVRLGELAAAFDDMLRDMLAARGAW